MIKVKRIYDAPSRQDGLRVLVDRVWPRGLSKEATVIDLWMRDVAPTTALRKWFAHDPEKWDEFCVCYARELEAKTEEITQLKAEVRKRTVTLLFGAKDEAHNNAVALKRYLEGR